MPMPTDVTGEPSARSMEDVNGMLRELYLRLEEAEADLAASSAAVETVVASDFIKRGTRALQPAATAVDAGTLYFVTDELTTERSDGATWSSYADVPSSAGEWTLVMKTATTTRTSLAVIANDPTLTFPMAASTKYAIRVWLLVQTSSVPDFSYRFTGPASPTFVALRRESSVPPGTAIVDALDTAYPGADLTLQGAGTDAYGFVRMEGTISNGVNSGTFAISWAQRVSDAGNTSVVAGSYIEYLAL